ncbi:outer membrane protein TolC [Hypnocyclicus thermotrophus]|uniref:Outer membrane protein TolC n=1 Tax=Hypnocyclicus thermotrophus TaxID=1627895 RepID=A0AA46I4S4_9FUSO|nr:TolC family protein [Hypnocyclicus thermotrophus]TDT67345.1 outer membrane protein TolC [Hypnocyclicus thermotrophus]
MKKVIMLIFIISSLSYATELTLNKSLEIAIKNNLSIRSLKVDNKNLEKDLEITENNKYGDIKYNVNASTDISKTSYSTSILYSQPIFTGGKITEKINIAKYNVRKGEITENNIISQISTNVIDKYIEALNYKKKIDYYENSIEELKNEYKKIKLKYENKKATKMDLLQIEANILSKESELIDISNQYEISIQNIKNLLNIENDFDVTDFDVEINNIDYENDLNKIINTNEVKTKEIELKIAESNLKIDKAAYLPEVNLDLSYGGNGNNITDSVKNAEVNIGVSISGTLFDFNETKNNIYIAKKDIEKINIEKEKEIDDLQLTLKTSYLNIKRINKSIISKEKEIELKTEIFKLNKIKYENNQLTLEDYLNSENDLLLSQLKLVELKTTLYTEYQNYLDTIN